jgi:hypothetical protein
VAPEFRGEVGIFETHIYCTLNWLANIYNELTAACDTHSPLYYETLDPVFARVAGRREIARRLEMQTNHSNL